MLPSSFNIDDVAVLNTYCGELEKPSTRNFMVTFNASTTECLINFGKTTVADVLSSNTERLPNSTRWINIWATHDQREIIETIAEYYEISPRNRGLLHPVKSSGRGRPAKKREHNGTQPFTSAAVKENTDIESGAPIHPSENSQAFFDEGQDTFATMIDELWHFYSVDRGARYIHVGYNALFTGPEAQDNSHCHTRMSRPFECRIWTSLLLCDDGTVISIYESPPDRFQHTHMSTLKIVRRNVLNVFRHLSRGKPAEEKLDVLSMINIRPPSTHTTVSGTDAPSLLCYYLFDDWFATYNLVTGRANRYRENLESLRNQMFKAADLELINSLHQTGQQLTCLKRVYQSYNKIITHLLERHKFEAEQLPIRPSGPPRRVTSPGLLSPAASMDTSVHDQESTYGLVGGLRLTQAALTRFERLRDRIELLALAEMEECLKEKESLVLMNFNLIMFRESQAIEKLAKVTILLAKSTLLFLPLGLVTGYFSMALDEVKHLYSLKTYWITFMVVGTTSFILIMLLGSTNSVPRRSSSIRAFLGSKMKMMKAAQK